jgi:hypothetical protein
MRSSSDSKSLLVQSTRATQHALPHPPQAWHPNNMGRVLSRHPEHTCGNDTGVWVRVLDQFSELPEALRGRPRLQPRAVQYRLALESERASHSLPTGHWTGHSPAWCTLCRRRRSAERELSAVVEKSSGAEHPCAGSNRKEHRAVPRAWVGRGCIPKGGRRYQRPKAPAGQSKPRCGGRRRTRHMGGRWCT